MEVIPLIRSSTTGSEPSNNDNGIKRHVQEWSRLDRLTGILEHARVEADQWTNHTANTKHKYGKVVDRRARNLADGSKQETQQTKQLEVFQAHTTGCSVQVIRSQTSTTSSWHNSSQVGSSSFQWPSSIFDKKDDQFDQLRLEHSPLDVSSQKNKASVGRSGSISARRPPTRRLQTVTSQLPRIESVDSTNSMETSSSLHESNEESVSTNLNRLKSCSNDEIRSDVNEPDEPLDRSSRFRRSLQFAQSKNIDSNHKVAGELENVLKKVLGKKLHAAKGDTDVDENSLIKPASPLKKPSFITVESLKKTKNNLRHLNEDNDKDKSDDGIETDVKPVGDSRSLDYRGSALTRTEEWYNRRKSYGFEKVTASDHNKHTVEPSAMDSSTDSGICRSTENGLSNSSRQSSVDRESIADLVKKYSAKEINNNTPLHAYNTTVVAKGKILEAINSLRSKSSAYFDVVKPNDTVSVSKENDERDKEQQIYTRRLSVGMDMSTDKSTIDRDEVPKRHSIAVVSEVADKEPNIDKKNANKKVEFCRTEVHFDAIPGKINIVDMDDKPAPTQLYRPKKRYNRPPEKNHGLPEYRFGDDVQNDVVLQINGNGISNDECTTTSTATTAAAAAAAATAATATAAATATEDDPGDSNNKPKSILKRQQQQQQQNTESSSGIASDNGIEVRISSTESTPVYCRRASWSVADRVKQVEAIGFSTRVNFSEGETTVVSFDPADHKKQRYSYNGTASPIWYQNNGNSSTTDASTMFHEKLLVRIGTCNTTVKTNVTTDLCAFSNCFNKNSGGSGDGGKSTDCLSSTSLVMNTKFQQTEQPSTYLEEMNTKIQSRFQKTPSTSWPRCGHKTYPVAAARKFNLLKSCADIKRDKATREMPDVIGALDDLSKTIDEQIVGHNADRHVTLIKVRQSDNEIHGRLEYAKDLMSTDETSEESLKADEEVRSYMAADCTNEDDNPSECENLKKLISTVKKNIKKSHYSQDNCLKPLDVKSSYESLLVVPNVTSVLLNHEKHLESERSQFQPVNLHTTQVTHVVKHQYEDVLQKQPSKRVPVKIVQDNRKNKPKTEISKTEVPVTKLCATVSLKQVPMTVQPKPLCNEKKKFEKKESIYGNIGYRANSFRIKDKPSNKQVQDLFNTGRDSWLNMPKDLGPKLNKTKVTSYKSRSRKEAIDSEISVLEELNKAADEILKAVNGYTDDESQHPNDNNDVKSKYNNSEVKLKNKKKAARLLQRANSREALLHLDEISSSDEDAADEVQRVKPKMQRKTKIQQTTNSVANKTTASFTKKIQSRTQNMTKTNIQHKVHPTYYGNVSNCTSTQSPMKFRNKPLDSQTKQVVDQKETKGRYQCKITARTFNSKKTKGSVEENKNSIKGC